MADETILVQVIFSRSRVRVKIDCSAIFGMPVS
jgi:hypothetical protein